MTSREKPCMKKLRFSIGGQSYNVEIEDPTASMLVMMINGKGYTVCREDLESAEAADTAPLPVANARTEVEDSGPRSAKAPRASSDQAVPTGSEAVRAPIPGKVLALAVDVGDRVRYSDALCTLEAMKMESVIRAPVNGSVQQIRVKPGDNVQHGDVLVVLHKLAE